MSSRDADDGAGLLGRRNATILAAILVAAPVGYAFFQTVGGTAAGYLLTVTLGVGVPSAYDDYGPAEATVAAAVGWVLAASAVATVVFVGVYLAAVGQFGASPLLAAIAAVGVTDLGGLLALLALRR